MAAVSCRYGSHAVPPPPGRVRPGIRQVLSGRQYSREAGHPEPVSDAVTRPSRYLVGSRTPRRGAMAIIPPAAWDPSGSERGSFAE